ncbi:MAG TPA: nickel pincer cofactor biosynthesis protein LarB [Urbifossiella sp.]|nr:nickel pincer cofactor biosynthesis protein LarB [Urbifossiella sp.]
MTPAEVRQLLADVRAGAVPTEEAFARLSEPAVGDLGFATLDLHRKERCGFPEVILAQGKTAEWVEQAVRRMGAAGQDCFVTRVSDEQAAHLAGHFPQAEQDRLARTLWLPTAGERPPLMGNVLVVTAGTGDLPVAQEAVVTTRVMGVSADLIADVGVAGIHRVLRHRDRLAAADVVVVVAGMDGALPSVVGGLVDCPVIACPTSVGYGAAFGGVAALLTMLNSCSAGVAVVNIDAGFKAGYVAALTARRVEKARLS